MGNRRVIAVVCRMAILGLAIGYFSFVLPGVLIGLGMAGDVPWTLGPAIMTAIFILVPPIVLIFGWRLTWKFERQPQP
jgi:hypothetical protein